MKRGKNTPKNKFVQNRQSLINKMSDALSIKYSNFFAAANYDTQTLKEDIGNLLSTQYYSKDPRDVFKPIESNILDIVKAKNPNLQVKIKKARKLPEIKYTKDKYQEADEFERGIDKEKEKEKDLTKMVRNAMRIIKEETATSEKFWQSPSGNAQAWEKVSVSTSKNDNTDPGMDTENWDSGDNSEDILGKTISDTGTEIKGDSNDSKPDDNSADTGSFDFSNDAVDVKDNDNSDEGPKGEAVSDGNSGKSNGTQFNQGGDPFSQEIGGKESENNNGETTKGTFNGWGDSLDNIVNDEIKKTINEIRKRNQ